MLQGNNQVENKNIAYCVTQLLKTEKSSAGLCYFFLLIIPIMFVSPNDECLHGQLKRKLKKNNFSEYVNSAALFRYMNTS